MFATPFGMGIAQVFQLFENIFAKLLDDEKSPTCFSIISNLIYHHDLMFKSECAHFLIHMLAEITACCWFTVVYMGCFFWDKNCQLNGIPPWQL